MKCKNCGKEIPNDSAFCPNCGKPINSIERRKNKIQLKNLSLKSILVIIAIGIWMLVLQNLGVIPVAQDIRVINTVDADVSGSVVDADVSDSVVDAGVSDSVYVDSVE